jgi:hypothetical protein
MSQKGSKFVPMYLQKCLKASSVFIPTWNLHLPPFLFKVPSLRTLERGAYSNYNMLNLVRWDAIPSGGNGLYHSIHGVCSSNTVPLDVPNPSSTSPSGPRKPTKWNQQMTHLSQPRKSTWIRHQNQLGNSKVVLCYIQKKGLFVFTAPVPTSLSNPWLGTPSIYMECARKALEMYSNLVTPEFVSGGGWRGSWAHTTLKFFFFISSWWSFFSFFSHKNFVKCACSACERHTSHSDSQMKIIKLGAFLSPVVVTSK